MLNSKVNGFIAKSVVVKANRANSSIMTVAAFQENFSSFSTGSKF